MGIAKEIVKIKQENQNISGQEIANRVGVTRQYVNEVLRENNLPTKRSSNFPAHMYIRFTKEDAEGIKDASQNLGLSKTGFIRMLWRLWKVGILKQKVK